MARLDELEESCCAREGAGEEPRELVERGLRREELVEVALGGGVSSGDQVRPSISARSCGKRRWCWNQGEQREELTLSLYCAAKCDMYCRGTGLALSPPRQKLLLHEPYP